MARGVGQPQERPQCWFCGRPGASKEHILARSFTELFGFGSVTSLSLDPHDSRPRRVVRSKRFSTTTRVACKDCNNGWMNRLDSEVRPLLASLVNGTPLDLAANDQRVLSAWACKVMFGFVSAEPDHVDRFVPQTLFRELERAQEPPPGLQLWLGAHPRDYDVRFVGYRVKLQALDDAPGFMLALSFGQGVIQLMYHGRTDMEYRLVLAPRAQLSQIWPPCDSLLWPNSLRITDRRIENLEHVMTKDLNGFRRASRKPNTSTN